MSLETLTDYCKPDFMWPTYLCFPVQSSTRATMNWVKYFQILGKSSEELGEINITSLAAVKKASILLTSPILSHYVTFHCINALVQHLPSKFTRYHHNFYEKFLKGIQYVCVYLYAVMYIYKCICI